FQQVGALVVDERRAPKEAGGLVVASLVAAQSGELLAVVGAFRAVRSTPEVDGGTAEGHFRSFPVAREPPGGADQDACGGANANLLADERRFEALGGDLESKGGQLFGQHRLS